MKDLLKRTLTGIFIVVFVFGGILLGKISFLILVGIIFILGIDELAKITSTKRGPLYGLILLSGITLIVAVYLIFSKIIKPAWIFSPFAIALVAPLLSSLLMQVEIKKCIIFSLLGFFWLAVPLSLFFALGWHQNHISYSYSLPLITITLIWIYDIFAYLTGTLIGKHKMAPVLSPGKTWEGFIGGMLFTILAGWITFLITESFTLWVWMVIAIIIVIFGVTGDLLESKLKRVNKIKNSGTLLPGHGGMLDLIDSLLLAAPAVLTFLIIVGYFAGS